MDDRFHSHPKALAASLAALGLWTAAGSWSSDHRTGGVVPDHVVPLLSRGASELADELVAAGLWKRVRAGYQFHDWEAMNPSKEEAIAQRDKRSSGGALGNHRRWHAGKGVVNPDCPFCQGEQRSPPDRPSDRYSDRETESGPNPPVPSPSPSDLYSRRLGNSRGPRAPSDDDEISINGHVPDEVWTRYAQLKLDRLSPSYRQKIDDESAYRRRIAENAPVELAEKAHRWWVGYQGITPHRLAQCLIDDTPPRDLPFSVPEAS